MMNSGNIENALAKLGWTLTVFGHAPGASWAAVIGPKGPHLEWLEHALRGGDKPAADLLAYLTGPGGWMALGAGADPGEAIQALEGYLAAIPEREMRPGSDWSLAVGEGFVCLVNADRRHQTDSDWVEAAAKAGELMDMPEFMKGWGE